MDIYYGHLVIPNFNIKQNIINLNNLTNIIHPPIVTSLQSLIKKSFNNNNIPSITIPSTIYIASNLQDYTCIVSSASVTTIMPQHLSNYQNFSSMYIYNVCTDIHYRGKGISKCLLDTLIYNEKSKHYLLDVYADNIPAISLYNKLGFVFVKSYYIKSRKAYVLEIKI